MSILDRDLIMRQIRFLQQLLMRVMKVQADRDLPTALEMIRNGYREALGIPYEMLARVDVGSARLLLGTPERQGAYVELLRAEASVLRDQGDDQGAAVLEKRASQLQSRAQAQA